MTPQSTLVKGVVEREEHGYIHVNEKQETNLPGLYAIGDCTDNYLKQVVTACGDGACAVAAAERYLTEKKQLDQILNDSNAKVAFIFFNPYETQDIDQATKFENALVEKYKVYRQDVSHQTILFNQLKLTQTVAAAL